MDFLEPFVLFMSGMTAVEIIASIGVLAGVIGAIYAAVSYHHRDKDNPELSVNYMRLFGAVEVPLIMRIISKRYKFRKPPDRYTKKYYVLGVDENDNQQLIGKELYNFWKKWEYKKASIVKNDLWEYCVKSNRNAKNIYYTAIESSQQEIQEFAKHPFIDGDGRLSSETSKRIKGKIKKPEFELNCFGSKSVGYLFIIISNNSKKSFTDLVINFRRYQPNPIFKDYSIDDYFSFLESEELTERNYNVGKISLDDFEYEEEQKKIASISPGKSIIWVLGVYLRNHDGFPQGLISAMEEPTSISFIYDGKKRESSIRKPYEEKAMKIDIPNGWFHQ